MKNFREKMTARALGKIVLIEILSSEMNEMTLINSYADSILDILMMADLIKKYRNKVNFLAALPQDGWTPDKLLSEIKRLLRI
jgi:hypothetical protein